MLFPILKKEAFKSQYCLYYKKKCNVLGIICAIYDRLAKIIIY